MKRIHLFEINDQTWLPATIRDAMTDYLQFVIELGRPYTPILPRLLEALDKSQSSRIVDLCSGSGGPWASLMPEIPESSRLELTDKFPNLAAFRRLQASFGSRIITHTDSVDAVEVAVNLIGFRTLFTSFHHFPPDRARALLVDAMQSGQGIGIFEATQRSQLAILMMLLTPVIVLIVMPFIRPFKLSRLLWTYVIPVLPLLVMFDGIVSCLRTYSPAELQLFVDELPDTRNLYHWEIGEERQKRGALPVTYLIGYPIKSEPE